MLKKVLAASGIVAAAGGVLFTGAPAMAADDVVTSGNGSVLSGNQLVADLDVPINVCGNSVAVLGVSGANCTDSGASVKH
ncbi:chaplin [Nocardiopsis sp. HNM0947]|uniref:Chaplin n=1 Tax=Nocardiopsis coralli TaxID=2772213 RepID=A0ABR9P1X9_9ACTN|nr:chaplin family protein [Nocardiopsis coralli]MBE2997844.1 chaplin [Nocardiopsis coralli]